jgi:hypothetical protein
MSITTKGCTEELYYSPKISEAHVYMSKDCGNFERGGSGLFILRNDCRARPFLLYD